MSDPIPLEKCFKDGCDIVVVVLTRPKEFERSDNKDELPAEVLKWIYPEAARTLRNRALRYNTQLWLAKQYEKKGKVLIVAPDEIGSMNTLTRNKEAIDLLYKKGYEDAAAIKAFL